MKTMWILTGLAVGGLLLTGCKKASESVAEKAMERAIERDGGGKAKVDIQGDKVTIKGADGTMEVGGTKIPDNFPKDVFLVKDGKVTMTLKTSDGVQVVLESKLGADKVAALYASEMKSLGWTEAQNVTMGNMAMLEFKKDRRTTTAVITQKDAGSQVQVVTTPADGK